MSVSGFVTDINEQQLKKKKDLLSKEDILILI